MSIFDTITQLVSDLELWLKYRPMINELEAVLKKYGIDIQARLSAGPDPAVAEIQTKLNARGAKLAVDGLIGPATLAAIGLLLNGCAVVTCVMNSPACN